MGQKSLESLLSSAPTFLNSVNLCKIIFILFVCITLKDRSFRGSFTLHLYSTNILANMMRNFSFTMLRKVIVQ